MEKFAYSLTITEDQVKHLSSSDLYRLVKALDNVTLDVMDQFDVSQG